MNTTQLIALRNMWEDVNREEETMTMRDMAPLPYNLSNSAMVANLLDGRKFYWSDQRELWIRYS